MQQDRNKDGSVKLTFEASFSVATVQTEVRTDVCV
jgi:hypothetical protein